ncbi:hypothetical protein [Mycolicibacterium austroafricanum]|uniref:hypothetical protein n=1 Tax=Mycolicibacterium austroafricanum TaxID=39687 RepID=UPI001CA36512|nr:hypothetical protein [Mycolicibacterium austroafricanum]QZT61292.1 hypothetical protein JN085_20205 [Mycolicibacterium austroafricanum]
MTAEYQAEVDASMERLRRRYEKAEKAARDADLKAQRAAQHAENLARKQTQAEAVAANRLAEEKRLSEYIEQIRLAAKEARVTEARIKLERQRDEAIARRNAETARRKAEARAAREQARLVAKARERQAALEEISADRRRELREIELLMMPGNYAGGAHRGRLTAQHNSGGRQS